MSDKMPAADDILYVKKDIIAAGYAGEKGSNLIVINKKEELLKKFNSSYLKPGAATVELSEGLISSCCQEACNSIDIIKAEEGGILAALFKYASEHNCGMKIRLKAVPIRQLTVEICEYYKLNPYRLLSEVYIIFSADSEGLIYNLKKAGIDAAKIGELSKNKAKVIMDKESIEYINRTKEDEIDKLNIKLLKERL